MRIGRNIRDLEVPFQDEIKFSIKNNFDLIQLWYKRGEIDMVYEQDQIKAIKNSNISTILHGSFDINDFEEYENDFVNTLIKLGHKETIIHPMIKTETINKNNHEILENKLLHLCNKLNELNIKVYIENNHAMMKTFYTLAQWESFFKKAPKNTEFLLDIVHVMFCDDYEYMRKLVKIKYPKCLHVADTKKGMCGKKHVHLPIGHGIIDFNIVFNDILKDFDGIIILEIKNTDENIVESKKMIQEYTNFDKRRN